VIGTMPIRYQVGALDMKAPRYFSEAGINAFGDGLKAARKVRDDARALVKRRNTPGSRAPH